MTHTTAELRKIVDGAALTKRETGILHSANRKCGLSYRAACNRNIEVVKSLKDRGYLKMTDNGKELGRFVFWATDLARAALQPDLMGEKDE